jgi:hypothetical protein
VIEAGAIVLPRDGGGQFHQLHIGEVFTKPSEERVRNLNGRLGHSIGVFKDESFQIREIKIAMVAVEVRDLFFRNPALSADGRANINSKRASDEGGNTQLGEPFQFMVDELAAHLGLLHLKISPEESRMVSGHLNRHNDAPETATSQVIDE